MSREPISVEGWNQLDPKVQTLWRVQNLISTVITSVLIGVPEFLAFSKIDGWPLPTLSMAGGYFVLSLVIGQWVVGRSYQNYRYQLGDSDLAVAKGVFWKSWKFVSRNRVQHVDITSGPIARALGIVQVSIFVGGMPSAVAVIPGLHTSEGEELRSRLVHDRKPVVPPVEEENDLTSLETSEQKEDTWNA